MQRNSYVIKDIALFNSQTSMTPFLTHLYETFTKKYFDKFFPGNLQSLGMNYFGKIHVHHHRRKNMF